MKRRGYLIKWGSDFLAAQTLWKLEKLRDLAQLRASIYAGKHWHSRSEKWKYRANECEEEIKRRPYRIGGKKGGKLGGKSRSEAKVAAAQKNAAKARAARKRKYLPCPGYKNHSHRFDRSGRCYSPRCREENPELWR